MEIKTGRLMGRQYSRVNQPAPLSRQLRGEGRGGRGDSQVFEIPGPQYPYATSI